MPGQGEGPRSALAATSWGFTGKTEEGPRSAGLTALGKTCDGDVVDAAPTGVFLSAPDAIGGSLTVQCVLPRLSAGA